MESDLLVKARELARNARPDSLFSDGHRAIWLDGTFVKGTVHALATASDDLWQRFDGATEPAGTLLMGSGPRSAANAAITRAIATHLKPVPLGLDTSAGFGDRLGLATPGHVRALRTANPNGAIRSIFAQQSIREMARTNRTPQSVMDDATWGALSAGWSGPVGADADHLKTEADVRACVDAGFTFFTFDPGDHVDDDAAHDDATTLDSKLDALPWDALRTSKRDMLARYRNLRVPVDGLDITIDLESLTRAAVKYGRALAQAAHLQGVLAATGAPHEIEVSVDETGTPTTLAEHAFLALELTRLAIPVVSLAPRFVGRFEKGVDFRGSLDELAHTLDAHARIARSLGPYKLSLHSGSDKFSVYPLIAEATHGLVHLKTAGTSYLEALRVTAMHDPGLFREILAIAHDRFEVDRATYLIGAELARVPAPDKVPDDDLPSLLDDDDARQVLHVTYGSALDAIRPRLLDLLSRHEDDHDATIERHFVRHLAPFVPHAHSQGGSA